MSRKSSLRDSIIQIGDFAKDGNVSDNQERLLVIARLVINVERVRMK